ncbi:hypothetical protein Tco_0772496 [Tanacetum coccineum]|uniref:Uncharacterized protein n=1 Tax=Tanacetum coccineum TaxID=301880 RepID=A0ABQ4ZLI2_9ASTR
MSSTLALNTSTYGTISSESKWKIEWLNSTSWKRIISLQTFSPKHYQENGENTMAEQNVPTQPPTRTDEQIVPRSQWLTIGKSNLLFNAQKIQKNPIFQISVDILSNTNFFQAFTASANVPAIYLQQFWNTMKYNEKMGVYSCQVDEQWFDLSADLLRKALAITPVIPAQPFELPPSGNTVIDFVNELEYPKPVGIVSNIRVNYVYQPWRAILSLINQCLTGKTSGSDKPRHPVLQMLWGIVTQTNVDHAELLWEEFTQGIQTFFSHKASHKASLKNPKKKVTPLLIPYGRFSKTPKFLQMLWGNVTQTNNVNHAELAMEEIRSRCVKVFGYILQELKKINLKKHEVKQVQQSCLGEDCWELFIPDLVPLGTDMQKSQENGQNQTNTDTGTDRVHKSQEIAINGQYLVNYGQHA